MKPTKGKSKAKKEINRPVISINVEADLVSLVAGIKKEGKIQILDFACRKNTGGEQSPDMISRDIQDLLNSSTQIKKMKKPVIHSTISGRKLCVRVLRMPVMPHSELALAIRPKVFKYISPETDEVISRFNVLGEVREKDIKKLEVVFAAVHKRPLEEYLQLFKAINVKPAVVTSPCFSEWNLVQEFGLNRGVVSCMLVDIESQDTELTIYRENRFIFTRNISIGSRDFTNIVKGHPQLSLDKPTDIRLFMGAAASAEPTQDKEADHLAEIKRRLQSEAEVLYKEIELTVHHYYQLTHGNRVDKCLILGPGSRIKGLVEFLKRRLEIPVQELILSDEHLNLPTGKVLEFKENLPFYAQAVGALLAQPEEINFAPKGRVFNLKFAQQLKFLRAPTKNVRVSLAFATLAIIMLFFVKGANFYYKHKIRYYARIRNSFEERTLKLVDLRRKGDTLAFGKKTYSELINLYPAFAPIIAKICEAIPSEKLILSELNFSRAGEDASTIKFSITGKILGEDVESSEITGFVSALEASGYFKSPALAIQKRPYFGQGEAGADAAKELSFVIDGKIKTN
jgi:type IV pilus assembly protein PilM